MSPYSLNADRLSHIFTPPKQLVGVSVNFFVQSLGSMSKNHQEDKTESNVAKTRFFKNSSSVRLRSEFVTFYFTGNQIKLFNELKGKVSGTEINKSRDCFKIF